MLEQIEQECFQESMLQSELDDLLRLDNFLPICILLPMNEQHLAWARSHDWGKNSELNFNGTITVWFPITDPDVGGITFLSFSGLRNWAGY